MNGLDLGGIGKKLSAADLFIALTDPSASIAAGYSTVTVTLKDGKRLSGFAPCARDSRHCAAEQ